jgi:ankyrin repeat protein
MKASGPSNGYLEYQKAYQRRGQGQDRTDLLILASYFGELDNMKKLISEGAEVNGTNERLVAPLISAAAGCQLSAVEFLLSIGADRSLQTDEGLNAFDFAFYLNDVAVARLVQIKNRGPRPRTPRDVTALIAEEVLRGDVAPGKAN